MQSLCATCVSFAKAVRICWKQVLDFAIHLEKASVADESAAIGCNIGCADGNKAGEDLVLWTYAALGSS